MVVLVQFCLYGLEEGGIVVFGLQQVGIVVGDFGFVVIGDFGKGWVDVEDGCFEIGDQYCIVCVVEGGCVQLLVFVGFVIDCDVVLVVYYLVWLVGCIEQQVYVVVYLVDCVCFVVEVVFVVQVVFGEQMLVFGVCLVVVVVVQVG